MNRTQYLPSELKTLGNVMKSAGYATGYFGKWHLGRDQRHHPSRFGFDEAYEYAGGGYYHSRFRPPLEAKPNKRLSETLTDMAVKFIEKNKEKPFFVFVAHYDVHVQLDADTALINKYLQKPKIDHYPCNAVYASMIEHIDRSVGRIVQIIDSLGLADDTMVIFFSDNGGLIKRFDNIVLLADSKKYVYEGDTLAYIATSNYPLSREKGTVYEGGIREPLIVKWPGKIDEGSWTDAMVSGVDVFPTLAEMSGANISQTVDGESMLNVLLGNDKGHEERAVFWHYPVYHHGVPASAVRQGDWKLIHNLVDNTYELYNLANDIAESHDLSQENTAKVKELSALLDQWRKEVGARLPVLNPDFDEVRRYEWARHPSVMRK